MEMMQETMEIKIEHVRTKPMRLPIRSTRPHRMVRISGGFHQKSFTFHEANYALNAVGQRIRTEASLLMESFQLSAKPVTNSEYLEFIQAGGYFQCEFWHELMHEAYIDTDLVGMERVLMFVDVTNCLGPAFWSKGACLPGTADEPVEGISWYEAMAYARWRGMRLPQEEEWVYASREFQDHVLPLVHQVHSTKERKIASSRNMASLEIPGLVSEWVTGDFYPGIFDMGIVRGGRFKEEAGRVNPCYRNALAKIDRCPGVGFRCAL